MISYERGGIHCILKIFKIQGSVFPYAMCVAAPCALFCGILNWLVGEKNLPGFLSWLEDPNSIMRESQPWTGFTFLVGFLVVFRTQMAYNRFWEGCTATYRMRAQWSECCSSLVSFCRTSKARRDVVFKFQQTLIRLFSMLHAVALADIEDCKSDKLEQVSAFKYDLIDAQSIDATSLMSIKNSDSKVELVYQWIQCLVVDNSETGVLSVPAPMLSRSFNEMANGMMQFHDALRISTVPFPFPYAQTCECLLVLHWLIAPFVVCSWTTNPVWAAVLCFVQVFILWCLNTIAIEIENPFGMDPNDIDACSMQAEFNSHLTLLVDPETQRLPQLSQRATEFKRDSDQITKAHSFVEVWSSLHTNDSEAGMETAHPVRRKSGRTAKTSRQNSDASSVSNHDFEKTIDVEAATTNCMEGLILTGLKGHNNHSFPSLIKDPPWTRSVSKDTVKSQASSITEQSYQDCINNHDTMTPTTATSRCSPAKASFGSDVSAIPDTNLYSTAVGLALPSEDALGRPHIPASKAWSTMRLQSGLSSEQLPG